MPRITLRVDRNEYATIETLVESGAFPCQSELVRTGLHRVFEAHDAFAHTTHQDEFVTRWTPQVSIFNQLRPHLSDEQTVVLEDTMDQLVSLVDVASQDVAAFEERMSQERPEEIVTDGGTDVDDSDELQTPPPKRGCEIAEIPDLSVGDVIRTHHLGQQKPRTLTVVEEGHDVDAKTLSWAGTGGRYVLEGYGTEYYLTTSKSLTGSWQRVDLVYKSRPEGETVVDIDIIETADGGDR